MKPAFLLDSVILIDHLRGALPAVAWMDKLGEGEAVISVITRAEVLSGGSAGEARPARELCDKFECVPITKDDATIAAELRRKYRWKQPDALAVWHTEQAVIILIEQVIKRLTDPPRREAAARGHSASDRIEEHPGVSDLTPYQ